MLLSRPLRRGNVGEHILMALRAMGPVLHPAVSAMWDVALVKLANYLKGCFQCVFIGSLSLAPYMFVFVCVCCMYVCMYACVCVCT